MQLTSLPAEHRGIYRGQLGDRELLYVKPVF